MEEEETNYDLKKDVKEKQISIGGDTIRGICQFSENEFLVGYYDGKLKILNQKGKIKKEFDNNFGSIRKIKKIDEKLFAIGVENGKFQIWSKIFSTLKQALKEN
jgi:tricorn protease-like protein